MRIRGQGDLRFKGPYQRGVTADRRVRETVKCLRDHKFTVVDINLSVLISTASSNDGLNCTNPQSTALVVRAWTYWQHLRFWVHPSLATTSDTVVARTNLNSYLRFATTCYLSLNLFC